MLVEDVQSGFFSVDFQIDVVVVVQVRDALVAALDAIVSSEGHEAVFLSIRSRSAIRKLVIASQDNILGR